MSKSYRRIETVRKAGEILRYLGNQKEPLTGAQISQAVGLPVGTVMCHLITLEELGFTQRIGEAWRIGFGLALIHARVKSSLEVEREKIQNQIKELDAPTVRDMTDKG